MNRPPLIVPTIALDVSLLDRLAKSVDYPVTKVAINGGRPNALDGFKSRWPDWKIFNYSPNLGFGGSCNMGTKLYPNEDGWILMNDDGEFMPGCLERMCKASEEHAKDCHVIYVNANDSFDICVWTKKGVKEFGLFDENYYPAYFEDYDMRSRFRLNENFKAHYIKQPFPVKHGKPRPTGPAYNSMMNALKPLNEDYMYRKWGTLSDRPVFSHPFNDPSQALNYWSLELENRERREVICKRFWSQKNPSLYD